MNKHVRISAEEELLVIKTRIAFARERTGNLCCHGLLDYLMADIDDVIEPKEAKR